MGRKRLPSKVLDARGAFTKHPERRRVDLEPEPGIGEPFDFLTPEVAAIWREVSAACPDGWLCVTDRYAFARYCKLVHADCTSELCGEKTRQLASLERAFGFTSTERSRVKASTGNLQGDEGAGRTISALAVASIEATP